MMAVWSDDEAVFCVHPGGGRLSGVAAVRGAWRSIFSEGPNLRFELVDLQAFTLPTVAVHTLYERIVVRGEGGASASGDGDQPVRPHCGRMAHAGPSRVSAAAQPDRRGPGRSSSQHQR